MTETEYVISNFRERFLPFRDLRIVLHGSRDYAREIIRHFAGEFRFVGVMSRDELRVRNSAGFRYSGKPTFPPWKST